MSARPAPPPGMVAHPVPVMSMNRRGPGRVLVAEDDPIVLRVMIRLLTTAGYEVEGVPDGEAAWAALNRERFALLITDHGMPRLSGLDLVKRLRTAQMDLPAIMVSAMMPTQELDQHPGLRLHARLLKPYAPAELLGRVAEVLGPALRPGDTDQAAHPAVGRDMVPGLSTMATEAVPAGEPSQHAAVVPSAVVTLTAGNFPAVVRQTATPVLILFWAEWCGPCKTISPALEELADQYETRVKVGRINIDEQPALAAEYGIRAVPTLLLLRRGRITDQIVGVRSRRELEESFDQVAA